MPQPWGARFATAAVAIPTLGAGLYYDATACWLLTLVVVGAAHEWQFVVAAGCLGRHAPGKGKVGAAAKARASRRRRAAATVALWGALSVSAHGASLVSLQAATLAALLATLALHTLSFVGAKAGPSTATALGIGLDCLGLLFLPWGFSHALLLRSHPSPHSWGLFLLCWLCCWQSDNGALFAGSALGAYTPKLLPAVSPGKTWAGAVGAVAASVGTAVGFGAAWPEGLPPRLSGVRLAGLGLGLGLTAVLGDMIGSVLKRAAGVKDSGALFKGHGGVIDRVDSIALSVPALYYALLFGGHLQQL